MRLNQRVRQGPTLAVYHLHDGQPLQRRDPVIGLLIPAHHLQAIRHGLCALDKNDLPMAIRRLVDGMA